MRKSSSAFRPTKFPSTSPFVPKQIRTGLILLAIIVFSVPGLLKLTFVTDILGVLPNGVPEVEALQDLRHNFDDDQQIIILLKHEEEVFEEDAISLTRHLRETFPSTRVEARSSFEESPEDVAHSLARMWSDADPASVDAFTTTLGDRDSLIALLQESKDKIELSIDQTKSTKAAYDPLGFLNHPAILNLQESQFSYQSDDGKYWLVAISNPALEPDYHQHLAWVNKIREALDAWTEEGFSYTLTGGPVFSAELGQGMENDISGTITITSVLVGLLFLLIQRNPTHLLFLALILGLVFLITLGIAGWIFGTLNLVSVGFAAILLGLVIDYGVVIARESKNGDSARTTRSHLAPSVLWAAITTAAVFGVLIFSTFNGVCQLGSIIAIGLCAGALVCLWIMPWATEKFPSRESNTFTTPPFLKAIPARIFLGVIAASTIVVFAVKGLPKVTFNLAMIEPESSEAAETLDSIQELFNAWSKKNINVMVTGDSPEEIKQALEEILPKVDQLISDGILEGAELPLELIPDPRARKENRSKWKAVADKADEIVKTMEEQGFTEQGRALGSMVLAELAKEPGDIDQMTRMFYQEDGYFSGRVRMADTITAENFEKVKTLNQDGVRITGWEPLQFVMLPMVKNDFYLLSLPATALLLLALGLVFRSLRDTILTALILIVVLLIINAMSSLTGRSWNFLNGMAIPLIVGTGIDYSIHLIFSLRRNNGDLAKVWNGVGKAICFCGLSTAIGFGSLLFASNQLLQSMGLFCCVGVLLTMVLSLLLIPGIWVANQRKKSASKAAG